MGYAGLQECVRDLEARGDLLRVDVPVDPHLELAAIQRRAFRAGAPALLFTRVAGTGFPVLANLFGTRERLRFLFREGLAATEAVLAGKADPLGLLRRPGRAFLQFHLGHHRVVVAGEAAGDLFLVQPYLPEDQVPAGEDVVDGLPLGLAGKAVVAAPDLPAPLEDAPIAVPYQAGALFQIGGDPPPEGAAGGGGVKIPH